VVVSDGTGIDNAQFERLDLLDRAHELLGDRDRQIEIRNERFRLVPGVHSYRALEEILPNGERGAFRALASRDITVPSGTFTMAAIW
jgi:hypothetical protein